MKAFSILVFTFLITSCAHTPKNIFTRQDEKLLETIPHESQRVRESMSVGKTDKIVPLDVSKRNLAQAGSYWSASDNSQVQRAFCRVPLPKTAQEIQSFYNKMKAPEELGDYEVAGILLKKERPRLVLALSKLLSKATKRLILFEEAPPVAYEKEFKVSSDCNKVLCASQKIFGKEVGPQMVYLLDQMGVNTSPYSFKDASLLRADEIKDVIRVFELTQQMEIPWDTNQKIVKFKRGYTLALYGDDAGVIANASIQLFDGWSEIDSAERQYALFHEIGHNLAYNYLKNFDYSDLWLSFSGWKKETKNSKEIYLIDLNHSKNKSLFVSRYGEESPAEDFAESISAYRFNPSLLKKVSKEKYDFIRDLVFNGVEFTSHNSCQRKESFSDLQKLADQYSFSKEEESEIERKCQGTFYDMVIWGQPSTFFKACVNFEAAQVWYKKTHSQFDGMVASQLFDPISRVSRIHFEKLREVLFKKIAIILAKELHHRINIQLKYLVQSGSNTKICESISEWSTLYNLPVEGGSFFSKAPYPTSRHFVRKGALMRLCQDLIHEPPPSSEASLSRMQRWIEYLTSPASFDSSTIVNLEERGFTLEEIYKYILEKTSK